MKSSLHGHYYQRAYNEEEQSMISFDSEHLRTNSKPAKRLVLSENGDRRHGVGLVGEKDMHNARRPDENKRRISCRQFLSEDREAPIKNVCIANHPVSTASHDNVV